MTATFSPDSCKPEQGSCSTVTQTFQTNGSGQLANPLVMDDAAFCFGFENGTLFDYSVSLRDAKGVETGKFNADVNCIGSG